MTTLTVVGDLLPSQHSLAEIEAAIEQELAQVKISLMNVHQLLHEARPRFATAIEHRVWAMKRFGWGAERYKQLMQPPEVERLRLERNRLVTTSIQSAKHPGAKDHVTLRKPVSVRELEQRLREQGRFMAAHAGRVLRELFDKGERHESDDLVQVTWSREDYSNLIQRFEHLVDLYRSVT